MSEKKKESIPENIGRGFAENVPRGCAGIVIGCLIIAVLLWLFDLV